MKPYEIRVFGCFTYLPAMSPRRPKAATSGKPRQPKAILNKLQQCGTNSGQWRKLLGKARQEPPNR